MHSKGKSSGAFDPFIVMITGDSAGNAGRAMATLTATVIYLVAKMRRKIQVVVAGAAGLL